MPQYDAGTAAIKIKPSFRGFPTEVETELRRYDFHLDINIGADTRVAAAEIANLRRAAGESTTFRVDANTATAAGEIAALRRAAGRPITANVRPQVDRAAANQARTESEKTAKQMRADLEKAFGGLQNAATLNLKVLGVVGAAGAIAQLAALTDAAANASHVIGLIPAIGFGGLAGIAAVATGFNGIPTAFKAMTAASKDSSDAATTQRDALQGVAEAEYQKQDADRGAVQAQTSLNDSYRDASRSLRDMNDNLVDQKFATQDAALSVQEAAQRLQKVQFDPTADSTQRARAKLSYDQAVQRLKEQQDKTIDLKQDTAEANAKGVEGSDQVTSAKQKIVEATHAQERAEQALIKSREDSAKPSSGQSKLDEARAKLSLNAKELVTDIRALGPAWTETRQASQDALTEGMGPAVTHLADVQLPALKDGLSGINGAINSGLRASIDALSSDTNKFDFRNTLDNTVSGFENAAKGSAGFTNALAKLAYVGSSFLPDFGTAIGNAGDRFNDLIQRTSADGSLKKWLQEGVDTTKELARIVGHVGSSIASLFRAAGDDGATLKKLEDLTDRMAKFLKSTEGQTELKEFFAEARANLEKLKPFLNDLPEIVRAAYEAFRTWSAIMLPFLNAASSLLAAHPALVKDIVIAYLAFKTIGPIVGIITSSVGLATGAMNNLRNSVGFTTGAMQAGFRSALSGTAAFLTGPWGIAIAAAATALLLLKNSHDNAARAADEQRQHEQSLQDTLDKATGKVTRETLESAGQELQQQGFFTRAQSFGIDPQTFLHATVGLADSDKSNINAQLTKTILEQRKQNDGFWAIAKKETGLGDTEIAQALQGLPEAVKKYTDAAAGTGAPGLNELKLRLNDVGESAATLGGKLNGYSTEVGSAGQKQRELSEALDGTFKLTEGAKQRFDELHIAVQSVPTSTSVIIKDPNSEAILQRLRDLKYDVTHNLDGTLTITADTARATADIQAVTTAPYNANVKVNFVWPGGIAGSLSQGTLAKLHESVDGVPIAPKATGGEIDGGVAGKDSVPILGMPGEHMLTTSDVDKLGGQSGAYRFRAALQRGQVRGYAAGGAIDETPQKASIGPAGNIVYPDQAGKGKLPAVGRTQALVDYARTLDGRPYGGDEDCSGLISKLANTAVGLSPSSGRMSTANEGPWLSALGFVPGTGSGGAFRVGWINDPSMAAGGHTAGTLPNNVNVESGGATSKVMYGGQAIGASASMFNEHAYLVMDAAGGAAVPGNASTLTTQSQLNPQAALPGRATDAQLQAQSGRAAVDSANSERNAVYANPASTAQDKSAADSKYQQAQNSLESATKSGDTSAISLQGIFAKAGGILANGILSGLGLENSILSESNVYNRAANTLVDRFGQGNQLGGGYSYTPQNLPSIATSSTPQSSATVNDPSLTTQIPGSGPITGGLAVDPNLGSTTVNVPGRSSYAVGAGSSQWRGLATQMLAREGFSTGQVDIMLAQIQSESGGDPNISQQITDINGTGDAAGVGLLQVIPGTFAAYRDPSLPDDRRNPSSNMAAALRYYKAAYGTDLSAQWGQGHGYADGGWVDGIGGSRGDGIRAPWVSPGEFVVNAYDAARNRGTLEAINSSNWSPIQLDPNALHTTTAGGAGGGHNFSTTIVEPRVANVGDLIGLAERSAQMKAIGLMAAL